MISDRIQREADVSSCINDVYITFKELRDRVKNPELRAECERSINEMERLGLVNQKLGETIGENPDDHAK